jgi:hypothetical protein
VFAEYDVRTGALRKEIPISSDNTLNFIALGNGKPGVFTATARNELVEVNLNDNSRQSRALNGSFSVKGDVTWMDERYYITTYEKTSESTTALQVVTESEDNSQLVTTEFMRFPGAVISGLAPEWSEDCSEKLLVCGWISEIDSAFTANLLKIRTFDGSIQFEACPYTMQFPLSQPGGNFFGFASYDNYINVCELRIDLDTDNSGSRFGPHFWQDNRCTNAYPIADDVSIRSLIGNIDSVTVKLRRAGSQVGGDRLSSPATDRLTVRNYGDTLIHLVANPGTTDEDFAEQLSRTLLETTADDIIPGERIVETYAYASGLRSDQARTFVQVPDPDVGDAGPDVELIVCEGEQADIFRELLPRARRGGTWFPSLNFDDLWDQNEQGYGVFRYTVDREDCPPDTAYVTVSPPTSFTELLQYADTSILLCPSKNFIWDVDIPALGGVVWDDGTTSPTRLISEAGFYTGTVTDQAGCLSEEIFLKVSDAPPSPPPSNELDRYCLGDTVVLADGFPLTTDSIVRVVFDRGLLCDSVHRIVYRFRTPTEEIQTATICRGDTLSLYGQAFTAAGNYEIPLPDGPCGTLVRLQLSTLPRDTTYLDTVLNAGELLVLDGVSYDTAGVYEQYFPDLGDCGLLRILTLDFQTNTQVNDQPDDFWHPNLLRAGTDALAFLPRSNTTSLTTERLEIYDLNGRRVFTNGNRWMPATHLAAGVYVFRVRLKVNGRLVDRSGRVVVVK